MGKNLKGKKLGIGICQREDGLYTACFVSKRTGKTVPKYFQKLQEYRNWLAAARFENAAVNGAKNRKKGRSP